MAERDITEQHYGRLTATERDSDGRRDHTVDAVRAAIRMHPYVAAWRAEPFHVAHGHRRSDYEVAGRRNPGRDGLGYARLGQTLLERQRLVENGTGDAIRG